MKDFIITTLGVLLLLPFLYMIDNGGLNAVTLSIMVFILFPTIYSLVGGAPFVPTPLKAVKKMIKMAKIKKGDKVYDIGCGDGRMVHLASKEYGAISVGLEIAPLVYLLARLRHFLWRSKAKILYRDFKHYDLRDADVVLCYLMPETLSKLQSKLEQDLKKGTRIVSYAFPIGTWKAKQKIERDKTNSLGPIWSYER